jgi:abortive infection bacteriophage resistance protein
VVLVDEDVKEFKTYEQQLCLLADRGMDMGDENHAAETLRRVNYYRLSGYWYPFRKKDSTGRQDEFYPGTRFEDVVALYDFDARLRVAAFAALIPLELAIRALLAHELGCIDPCAHLDVSLLGATARSGDNYRRWFARYNDELTNSREDFVAHHNTKYGGVLPVWAAVELLDWGSLTHLYGFSPRNVQEAVASSCGLRGPQLLSWLKALNLVRNTCAHHGRLFNKVHTITPKLPRVGIHKELDEISVDWSRTFGQLSLIQFLSQQLGTGNIRMLPTVLKTYPSVRFVPISHIGVPDGWRTEIQLWSVDV